MPLFSMTLDSRADTVPLVITRSNVLCQVLATSNVARNNKKHPGNAPTSSILLVGVHQVVFHFKYSCPLLPLAAAMAFYTLTLSCSPSSMPAPTWSLWCPDAPLMCPMTGTMPQQKPHLTLPPFLSLTTTYLLVRASFLLLMLSAHIMLVTPSTEASYLTRLPSIFL